MQGEAERINCLLSQQNFNRNDIINAGDTASWHKSEFVKYCMYEDAAQVCTQGQTADLNFYYNKKGRKKKRSILFMNLGGKKTNIRKAR